MGDGLDRETNERSITLPVEFERELMAQYPSASRVPEAAKLAIQEAVEARQADVTPADIYEQVRAALESVTEEGSAAVVVAPVDGDLEVTEPEEAVVVEDLDAVHVDAEPERDEDD